MRQFEEIFHAGGIIKFIPNGKGGMLQQFTHSNPWHFRVFQVCVSYKGQILDVVPSVGIGQTPIYPQPSLLAYVISDRTGMFGYSCPKCKSYFRTSYCNFDLNCPYCFHRNKIIKFLTENQKKFILSYCNKAIDAHNQKKEVEINLDNLIDNLENNANTPWIYSEKNQQNRFTCSKCNERYDILGEYAICPGCQFPNYRDIIDRKIISHEEKISALQETQDIDSNFIIQPISDFEGFANEIKRSLEKIPMILKRRKELKKLSFQRVIDAAAQLKNWFAIDLLKNFHEKEKEELKTLFHKRHLFVHNSGRVDQKYLDETKDDNLKLYQTIKLYKVDIENLLAYLKRCVNNLYDDYNTINIKV